MRMGLEPVIDGYQTQEMRRFFPLVLLRSGPPLKLSLELFGGLAKETGFHRTVKWE